MNQLYYTSKHSIFKQLNLEKRIILETLLKQGLPQTKIASIIGVHRSTISRELKRGSIDILGYDLKEKKVYEAKPAQVLANKRNLASRKNPKYLLEPNILKHIRKYIIKHKYSFEIIAGRMKYEKSSLRLSCSSMYNYYHKGILDIPKRYMPSYLWKNSKTKRTRRENIEQKRINMRPIEINNRLEPMHWESDLIISTTKKSPVIYSSVERKYRLIILHKLPNRNSEHVINLINNLEAKTNNNFSKYFRSITCDNGAEFQKYKEIEQNQRTTVYYAHPYSSWERGTNENLNREVRRFFPKRMSFKNISQKQIREVQDWMNNKPRKILGYKTPIECLKELYPEFLEMGIV